MKLLKLSSLFVCVLITGCATYGSDMSASPDINPDINGDPSPIAVTIFELSDPISFEGASFVSLYTNPQAALGSTLLAQKSVVLAPGETRSVSLPIEQNAAYLGYIAAYRNYNSNTWQTIVPVSTGGSTSFFGQDFTVNVSNSGISVQN